jgi:hypothetical protein
MPHSEKIRDIPKWLQRISHYAEICRDDPMKLGHKGAGAEYPKILMSYNDPQFPTRPTPVWNEARQAVADSWISEVIKLQQLRKRDYDLAESGTPEWTVYYEQMEKCDQISLRFTFLTPELRAKLKYMNPEWVHLEQEIIAARKRFKAISWHTNSMPRHAHKTIQRAYATFYQDPGI